MSTAFKLACERGDPWMGKFQRKPPSEIIHIELPLPFITHDLPHIIAGCITSITRKLSTSVIVNIHNFIVVISNPGVFIQNKQI